MDNRRKKTALSGNASSAASGTANGQKAVVKQNTRTLFSPVNPFEADQRKENQSTPVMAEKRKDAPSKTLSATSLTPSSDKSTCKRLSSDFHRKCCAHESDKDHDPKSCKDPKERKGRVCESPSPTSDKPLYRRSQSVPRTALRPIPMTLSSIKRTEFNLERARDAASNSPTPSAKSLYASACSMSARRSPFAAAASPSVFSTQKTPVRSTARIAKGIISGQKQKTPPTPAARSLALPTPASASAVTQDARDGPTAASDDRQLVPSSSRVDGRAPGSRDVVSSRSTRDTDHVTVTQSGGKGNVNIKMRISMAIKKEGEAHGTEIRLPEMHRRSLSPRPAPKALLNYPAAAVKEYPVEKMAISVAVRLRPFSTKELKNPDVSRVVFLDKDRSCVTVGKQEFEFNQVLDSFDPDPIDGQEQVYEVVGRPLLDHCLEGYNACLFAYGQTGSGKTYSLTGEEDVVYFDKEGVIPRLIKDLFVEMQLDSIVSMTYIEIYNDQIFNLLGDAVQDMQQVTYKIRESTVYGPYIPNLPPVIVESADDLLSRWSLGNIKRQKAATASNEHSSRSHAILQITVQQKYQCEESTREDAVRDSDVDSQASEGDRLVSKINLVDLAGSERVAQAHTTGDRFKEGTAINKSLLTLGKVIQVLSNMAEQRIKAHIPYRDSTLTFLLKESLGGNSRTCMLATISPANTQVEETLSTLR